VADQQAMTLIIGGGAARFNWLPIFAAERLGLFEKRGLKVEIKRLGTVDKATAAVKSGELDVAITPPEGAIKDAALGGKLRIIAGNANSLPLTLIANRRFRKIEELKGAKLGTSSLTEGTALYTMEVLRRHGLNYPGDYEFAIVGVHPGPRCSKALSTRRFNPHRSTSSPSMPAIRISARSRTTSPRSRSPHLLSMPTGPGPSEPKSQRSCGRCARRPNGCTTRSTTRR
jgi:hypothetical protein